MKKKSSERGKKIEIEAVGLTIADLLAGGSINSKRQTRLVCEDAERPRGSNSALSRLSLLLAI